MSMSSGRTSIVVSNLDRSGINGAAAPAATAGEGEELWSMGQKSA